MILCFGFLPIQLHDAPGIHHADYGVLGGWDCEEWGQSRDWNWRVVGPEYPTLEMWRVVGPRVDCGRSAAGWGV